MNKTALIIMALFMIISVNPDIYTAPKKAPGIALYDLNDNLVILSALTEKNSVIISFWATYCIPCKKEMLQLVELRKKYENQKKIKLLLVNIDNEGKEKAQPVLEELSISDQCLLDRYQVNAKKYIPKLKIPAVFLVNKNGYIVFEAVGESEENIANLEKAILKL